MNKRTAYQREYYRKNAERRRRQRLESHARLGLPHKYVIQIHSARRVHGRALKALQQSQGESAHGSSNL